MKLWKKEGTSEKNVPLLLLLTVGIIEFLYITLERQFSSLGYYLAETYVIVPCLLFFGYMLQKKQEPFVRRRLLLSVAAIFWFVIVQCIHKLSGMENHPMATVFLVYLMAFPFASLSEDRENAGLRLIGIVFVTASLVLVGYTALLLLDLVPAGMKDYLFWDGARLNALWHPNLAANYFMMGIGFCAMFCARARKKQTKVLLIVLIVIQMAAMALTNCRTTLLLTGAMLGGALFFRICKGSWKRFLLGLMVAGLMLVGCFKVSGKIFQWNNDRLLESYGVVREESAAIPKKVTVGKLLAVEVSAEEIPAEQTDAEELVIMEDIGIIIGDNEQNSLAKDMRTLNGRTLIWGSALRAIRDNKAILLWGTEYTGTAISVYNSFNVVHAHNSWMETQMRMGLPGLAMALVFTALSVWSAAKLLLSSTTEQWKKIVAMLAMCVMASGFLEPYLFITNVYYHVADFMFFFLTGYLDFWSNCKKKV